MASSIVVFFVAAANLCAASPQQCALDNIGECRVEAPPAARDHLLLQLGAPPAAPGRKRALAALADVSGGDTLSTTPPPAGLKRTDSEFVAALMKVVAQAQEAMRDEVPEASGDNEKANIDELVRTLKLDLKYKVPGAEDVQRSPLLEAEAIRKVAETEDTNEAIEQGRAMTAVDLEKINGESDTPETTNTISAYEGDMLAEDQVAKTWTRFEPIHFCFASDVDRTIEEVFLQATAEYERLIPCITFEKVDHRSGKSTDPDGDKKCKTPECDQEMDKDCSDGHKKAIFVQSLETGGCHSQVGMMPQPATIINLMPKGCAQIGTAVHMLGHALGVGHELSRADRDQFFQVNWGNIDEANKAKFETNKDMPESTPYDIYSVFQSPEAAFHKKEAEGEERKTIQLVGSKLQQAFGERVGQRMGLTHLDAEMVMNMYGCSPPHSECGIDYCWKNEPVWKGGCVCHLHDKAVFKDTRIVGGCHRCITMCPSDNTCDPNNDCDCPPGLVKRQMQSDGGKACYQCGVPEPTGEVKDAASMTDHMERILALMPEREMNIYKNKINDAFKKGYKVTVERWQGGIEVTTKKVPTGVPPTVVTKERGTW